MLSIQNLLNPALKLISIHVLLLIVLGQKDSGLEDHLQHDFYPTKIEAKFEIDDSARSYRAHFLGYDHQNFTSVDDEYGPVVLSIKHYNDKDGEMKGNHVRVILRTTSGTVHRLLPYNDVRDTPSPVQLARSEIQK